MNPSDVTLIKKGIHNPKDPRHFMRVRPADKIVEVWLDDECLAQSKSALLVQENGFDMYDPAYYVPTSDIVMDKLKATDKSTHCPLKGDTTYFDYTGGERDIEGIGWEYSKPFDRSEELKGHIAFDTNKVKLVIAPL
jgi:uncharacterized protein (DUF427 family)